MRNFECHITLYSDNAAVGEAVAKSHNWKTSKIDGDPLLGQQVFFYLTKHSTDYDDLKQQMGKASAMLITKGALIARQKIEEILFDTKRGGDVYVTGD